MDKEQKSTIQEKNLPSLRTFYEFHQIRAKLRTSNYTESVGNKVTAILRLYEILYIFKYDKAKLIYIKYLRK